MDVKTSVKVELAKRGMTLTEFAHQLGIPQQSLSRTLNGSPINQKSHWPRILDALNLELSAIPQQD